MQPFLNACVFIVDDDASVRDAMAWLLRSRRLMSETFESADAFENVLNERFPGPHAPVPSQAGCILLDVRMPGQSGLALFETLVGNGLALTWPIIFLTGHADVPTAVDMVEKLYSCMWDYTKKIHQDMVRLEIWDRMQCSSSSFAV